MMPSNEQASYELPVSPVPFIGCANSTFLELRLELLHECSEMPRDGSRNGVVYGLRNECDRGVSAPRRLYGPHPQGAKPADLRSCSRTNSSWSSTHKRPLTAEGWAASKARPRG